MRRISAEKYYVWKEMAPLGKTQQNSEKGGTKFCRNKKNFYQNKLKLTPE